MPVVILAKYYSSTWYMVGCFGTSQLERATRFPNVPTRARNSFWSVQYYNLGKLTVQLILNIPLLLLAMYSRIQL